MGAGFSSENFYRPQICEGYVFTGVCLSTRGRGFSVRRRGLCPGKGLCPGGSLSRGVSVHEVYVQGGVFVRESPGQRPPMVKNGWYAPYRNAYLLNRLFLGQFRAHKA